MKKTGDRGGWRRTADEATGEKVAGSTSPLIKAKRGRERDSDTPTSAFQSHPPLSSFLVILL